MTQRFEPKMDGPVLVSLDATQTWTDRHSRAKLRSQVVEGERAWRNRGSGALARRRTDRVCVVHFRA